MTDRLVQACPECDATQIANRSSRLGGIRKGNPDHDYRCTNCGATFDDPVEREPKRPTYPHNGLAKRLAEMDPADLGDDPTPPDP